MCVQTESQTLANIMFPIYYYFCGASWVYGESARMKRKLRKHNIPEILIDIIESACFARSIITSACACLGVIECQQTKIILYNSSKTAILPSDGHTNLNEHQSNTK